MNKDTLITMLTIHFVAGAGFGAALMAQLKTEFTLPMTFVMFAMLYVFITAISQIRKV